MAHALLGDPVRHHFADDPRSGGFGPGAGLDLSLGLRLGGRSAGRENRDMTYEFHFRSAHGGLIVAGHHSRSPSGHYLPKSPHFLAVYAARNYSARYAQRWPTDAQRVREIPARIKTLFHRLLFMSDPPFLPSGYAARPGWWHSLAHKRRQQREYNATDPQRQTTVRVGTTEQTGAVTTYRTTEFKGEPDPTKIRRMDGIDCQGGRNQEN